MADDADILNELVRLLGSAPEKATFRHDLDVNHEWLGAVLFVTKQSGDISLITEARTIASNIMAKPIVVRDPRSRLLVILQELKRDYEFRVGYSIPRNYIELSDSQSAPIVEATIAFKDAVRSDNEIPDEARDILLCEIAMFEASLGAARLSPDLVARFVNGFLKGSIILASGTIVKQGASRLADLLLDAIGWVQ